MSSNDDPRQRPDSSNETQPLLGGNGDGSDAIGQHIAWDNSVVDHYHHDGSPSSPVLDPSSMSLKVPSFFSLNYNSLKAAVTLNFPSSTSSATAGGSNNSSNPYAMTYTAGEDASRLAMVAKQLGLERQRKARAPVRSIELNFDHALSIMATATPHYGLGGRSGGRRAQPEARPQPQPTLKWGETLAGVAGNILEWYDFAVFGYFGDVLGKVFFPPSEGHTATLASFAVFGGAFIARPAGGVVLGYIGDVYGRKVALRTSIFLMAFPTFFLGCLPSFAQVGYFSPILLIIVRLLQGLSVGGQLLSSLVFTLERSPPAQWGLYGSFVFATGNLGTLLGGLVGYWIRAHLSPEQLLSYGWRIPFWMGVLVSWSGLYLRNDETNNDENDATATTTTTPDTEQQHQTLTANKKQKDVQQDDQKPKSTPNPLLLVLEPQNIRPLLACATVPMLWSTGFYLTFVWMPIFMTTMSDCVVPHAFAVNSLALLFSVVLLFPIAGWLSDIVPGGRRTVMTVGGISVAILTPWYLFPSISESGEFGTALSAQILLGVCLSFWGSPMCAWLVEAFPQDSEAKLTSMAIGYNVALAIVGGLTPALATYLVDASGPESPAWIYSIVAFVALFGLWIIAPAPNAASGQ
ncbi:hypothetical protein ACA910_022551 [Epithemia clementina (nom. ined.)]